MQEDLEELRAHLGRITRDCTGIRRHLVEQLNGDKIDEACQLAVRWEQVIDVLSRDSMSALLAIVSVLEGWSGEVLKGITMDKEKNIEVQTRARADAPDRRVIRLHAVTR